MTKVSNKWRFENPPLQDFMRTMIKAFNNQEATVGNIIGMAWSTAVHSVKDCWDKFHATTGHKHTGGADDAPKIDQSSINKVQNGDKFYLSHTTESYLLYTDTGIEMYWEGTKVASFS